MGAGHARSRYLNWGIYYNSSCLLCSYLLEPNQLKKLFGYIQHPSFDIAADAADAFKDLLTRHKSTVSESLSKNYCWFFTEMNEKLLKSENYITRRQAVKV
ncbi:putative armadillo-like helical protein [Helianthus annuus]|nr:putative armadillo-like helical protein [Helianthus annuus]